MKDVMTRLANYEASFPVLIGRNAHSDMRTLQPLVRKLFVNSLETVLLRMARNNAAGKTAFM